MLLTVVLCDVTEVGVCSSMSGGLGTLGQDEMARVPVAPPRKANTPLVPYSVLGVVLSLAP